MLINMLDEGTSYYMLGLLNNNKNNPGSSLASVFEWLIFSGTSDN